MASLVQLILFVVFLAESVSLDQHSHLHNLYIPTVKKHYFFAVTHIFIYVLIHLLKQMQPL